MSSVRRGQKTADNAADKHAPRKAEAPEPVSEHVKGGECNQLQCLVSLTFKFALAFKLTLTLKLALPFKLTLPFKLATEGADGTSDREHGTEVVDCRIVTCIRFGASTTTVSTDVVGRNTAAPRH
ncbi:hypothetical protein SDRG_00675 [Saprolegnia diclina VS20]|uniref:Uncharacterized protein n=1 Tax=Saprolegnia diclina (strain VS20) TaxID=1156394 RepID=T0R4B4_SAPDV|nr:hypothetical protein SDRG_00675 [Saprolegnia diclina VS20]EQC41816.1 hypothetical protein SDRG_00675 [Saprolegnia diclina VS20]|eukprot:XP_008604385.1 hypothetical protein SDRG_00675 [Saprolegnia diclina VS20]